MGKGINTQQPVVHALNRKVTFADFATSGAVVSLGAVPVGSMILRANVVVTTAFNQTPSLLVGNLLTANKYIAAGDVDELSVAPYMNKTTGSGMLTADEEVLVSMTFTTAATAGVAQIVLEYMPPVMNKEASGLFDTNN